MTPEEFLKKYGLEEDEEKDHTLREAAINRARELHRPHAGTPFDWEDWEDYKRKHPEARDE